MTVYCCHFAPTFCPSLLVQSHLEFPHSAQVGLADKLEIKEEEVVGRGWRGGVRGGNVSERVAKNSLDDDECVSGHSVSPSAGARSERR